MKQHTMKRAIAMLLAMIMSIGILTACGSSDTAAPTEKPEEVPVENAGSLAEGLVAEEGAEIELAYWEGSESDKAAWDAILAKLAKDHPEIKVTLQTYPSNEFRDVLDTRAAGGDWPDIIRYSYQRLGKFKAADVMLDLTPYISQESVDDLSDAFRSACTYNGKLVAMPHHTDTMAVFYNKRMFEEAGIRIPTSPEDGWTWDEMLEIARTLKEKFDLPYATAGIWEQGNGYRYLPFVYMNGGSLLSEDQMTATATDEKTVEAIKLYETMRNEDLISNTGFSSKTTANSLLVAEQVAFTFSGSWHCSYMEENMPGNWGITYMPVVDGKTSSDIGGNALFGYAGTEYPKATAIVIDYITNEENMREFCEVGNFIPVRTSLLESGLNYTQFAEPMKILCDIVGTIDPKMAADETSVPFQQINEIFNEEMDPVAIDGSVSAEQAAQNMQDRITEILEEQ